MELPTRQRASLLQFQKAISGLQGPSLEPSLLFRRWEAAWDDKAETDAGLTGDTTEHASQGL